MFTKLFCATIVVLFVIQTEAFRFRLKREDEVLGRDSPVVEIDEDKKGSCTWKLMGCLTDNVDNRVLKGTGREGIFAEDMSIDKCHKLCSDKDFPFSGVENGKWCLCGKDVSYMPDKSTNCNVGCGGNKDEICGGNLALSLYKCEGGGHVSGDERKRDGMKGDLKGGVKGTSTEVGKELPKCEWKVRGCSFDRADKRRLQATGQFGINRPEMTVKMCLKYCQDNKFKLAGVEMSTYCFCDDELKLPFEETDKCTMHCGGDKNDICGGNEAINIYECITG